MKRYEYICVVCGHEEDNTVLYQDKRCPHCGTRLQSTHVSKREIAVV